jgi:hypothetical protein
MIDVHRSTSSVRGLFAWILPGKNHVLLPDLFSPTCRSPRNFTLQDDQEIKPSSEYETQSGRPFTDASTIVLGLERKLSRDNHGIVFVEFFLLLAFDSSFHLHSQIFLTRLLLIRGSSCLFARRNTSISTLLLRPLWLFTLNISSTRTLWIAPPSRRIYLTAFFTIIHIAPRLSNHCFTLKTVVTISVLGYWKLEHRWKYGWLPRLSVSSTASFEYNHYNPFIFA